MFSLDSFYLIISKNLLQPIDCTGHYFKIFGSTEPKDLRSITAPKKHSFLRYYIFYDQEPIYNYQVSKLDDTFYFSAFKNKFYAVIANSEHSEEKDNLLEKYGLLDWYYFFHGFAALDWYKNIRYMPPIRTFSKVFISFNNLVNEKRSYRLTLISMLIASDLDKHGYISMTQQDTVSKIKKELFSPHSLLSKESKHLIYKTLLPEPPRLVIDVDTTQGMLSADDNLDTLGLGLFHVVTETIFYEEKLHLTEKIFKPIVARRPFFLVGAPGNLAYLKGYGFKTFDRWIDESYDLEKDPDQRLKKIVHELDRLCKLNPQDLDTIYQEMQQTLEYNFNWFYSGFREQITHELVDNFKTVIDNHNAKNGDNFENYVDPSSIDFAAIKKLLLQ